MDLFPNKLPTATAKEDSSSCHTDASDMEKKHPPSKPLTRHPSWRSRMSLDNWAWELAAAGLCLGVLIIIAGILLAFNGRAVPDLPDSLNMNSVISLLATLAKASLMVVLAAAIRQEKWLWFIEKPRSLDTVDAFEEASRGPYGSLHLLFSRRASLRALLAALTMVLSLGFESFIQQVVNIEVRYMPLDPKSAFATIRTPISYNETVEGNLGGSSLSLNALIGAFGGAAGAIPDSICPTGNCTWPIYDTLALCTVCENMTDKVNLSGGDAYSINLTTHLENFLSRSNNQTSTTSTAASASATTTWTPSYTLPYGNALNVSVTLQELDVGGSMVQWSISYPRRAVWPLDIDPATNSLWSYSWDNSSYAGMPVAPLFAMGYLDMDLTPDSSRLVVQGATACAFSPCVRTMDTQVRSGRTVSEATATNYGQVIIDERWPDGSIQSGWVAQGANGVNYSILDAGMGNRQGRAYLLIQALRIALEGNTTYSLGGYWYPDPSDGDSYTFDSTGFTQDGGPWSSAGQQAIDGSGNFSAVVEGVGRALTGRFQQLQDTVAVGTVLRAQATVVVRWPWMAYPLALVAFGLTGLFLTILSTRQHSMAVWKESTLPLLFRYMGPTKEVSGSTGSHGDEAGAGLTQTGEKRGSRMTTGRDPGMGFGRAPHPGAVHRREDPIGHSQLCRPTKTLTTLTFSNTLPPSPTSNRVSSIVNQAANESVQLRRRDSFWVLDSETQVRNQPV